MEKSLVWGKRMRLLRLQLARASSLGAKNHFSFLIALELSPDYWGEYPGGFPKG